jgi:hypothetical protein
MVGMECGAGTKAGTIAKTKRPRSQSKGRLRPMPAGEGKTTKMDEKDEKSLSAPSAPHYLRQVVKVRISGAKDEVVLNDEGRDPEVVRWDGGSLLAKLQVELRVVIRHPLARSRRQRDRRRDLPARTRSGHPNQYAERVWNPDEDCGPGLQRRRH